MICKNVRVHRHVNVNAGHKIVLGETDAFEPPPVLNSPFLVRCNDCDKEYSYEAGEVLRHELELPASFMPHPLFR